MECPICFNESSPFKILECGHSFCSQCIEDLSKSPVEMTKNGDSTKNDESCQKVCQNGENGNGCSSDYIEKSKVVATNGIPCPQCRMVTKIGYNMKNKYGGQMMCRHCDEKKPIDEFRWCHDCSTPVCSKCFVDKHVGSDPSTGALKMHQGSKWDDAFPQAAYCISRLQNELTSSNSIVEKQQEYLRVYLEGFKEYMNHKIEENVKLRQKPISFTMQQLGSAFGIDIPTINPKIQNSESKNIDSLLTDLVKIAGLKIDDSKNIQEMKLKSPPYPEMARFLSDFNQVLEIPKKSTETNEPPCLNLKHLFKQSTVIILPEVKNPADLCYLEKFGCIAITDYDNGLFIFDCKNLNNVHRLNLRKNYQHFSKITATNLGSNEKCLIFMNVQHGTDWGFIVCNVEKRNEQFVSVESHYYKFPCKENCAMACTNRGLICCSSTALYYAKFPEKLNFENFNDFAWIEIYGGQKFNRNHPICQQHGIDNVKISIFNDHWKSIDLIEMSEIDCRVKSIIRKSVRAELKNKSCLLAMINEENWAIWAKNDGKVFCENFFEEKVEPEVVEFGASSLMKMIRSKSDGKFWCLFHHIENSNCRQMMMMNF